MAPGHDIGVMSCPGRVRPGLLMLPYTAEPGSASHDKLQLLANWGATARAAASGGEATRSTHEWNST
jgi:hypothetical protein